LAHSPIFNADNFVYWMGPQYEMMTRRFDPPSTGTLPLQVHVLIAFAIATVSSAVGLWRGDWKTKVRR
jgi:hypothetical protein